MLHFLLKKSRRRNFMKSRKWLATLFAVVMVIAMLPAAVSAVEGDETNSSTVYISTDEDLVNAIKNQADGQTWVFTEARTYDAATPAEDGNNGGYDLPDGVDMPYPDGQMANHPGPYVFPIYVEDLTICKASNVGEVIITSSAVPTLNDNEVDGVNGGGNWNWQSFMIISGSGVTIQDVTLLGNQNAFNVNGNNGLYGMQCDKIIETVDGAGDLTLRNVVIAPTTVQGESGAYSQLNGTQRSGSLYFSHAYDASKTVTLENVTTYGGIKSANDVNILINGVTSNFTNNTYASYDASSANYAWNPGIRGGNVGDLDNVTIGENGFTIVVDDSIDSRQIFNESLQDGMTIQLLPGDYNLTPNNTYSVEGQTGWYMPITKSVTIQGVDANGDVITDASQTQANLYSTHYSSNGSWPSQNLITVFADDVVIEGVTIMNKVDPNKAVEVVGSDSLNTFTVRNCKFAPISEDLVDQAAIDAGYSYSEYAQYGASLYLSATGKYAMDVNVENNLFSYSSISLGATTEGTYNITGNVFDGAKNWNQDPDYYYSSIGYQGKWLYPNPDCTTLGSANVNISGNDFTTAGSINFSQIVTGDQVASFSGNTGLDVNTVSGPVEVDGQILVDSEEALNVAIAAADENTTIVLTKDIELDAMLDITKSNITIDLNGNTITASDAFTGTFDNDKHLIQVNGAENVTIANGSIVTTDANKHGVNLYNSTGVVLKDVTIDHTNAMKGAPLVLNNSSATVEGKLDLVVGTSSWYGINIDPKDGQASLTFADDSHVSMTGNDKLQVIQLDGEQADITITGAEDAGLDNNGDGTYGPHTHVYDTSKWLNDETNHWHECACGEKSDVAAHTFVWVTDKEATATQAGSKHQECSVCGYKLAAVEIPATGDNSGNTGDNGNAGNTGDNGNTGNTGNNTNNTTNNGPKTGDNSNITFAVIAMLVACCGMVAILVYNGKIKAAYHGKHVSDK